MRRAAAMIVCACALFIDPAPALRPTYAQEDPRQPPAFRAGIDIVQLDVSVLDRSRRPVPGLTAADFTVLEDGEPRPIVAFTNVNLAPPPESVPTGLDAVAPDVASNALPDGRLVVILLDQSTRPGAPVVLARRIAAAAVDALGPGDLAAVIHTDIGRSQNFTADRVLLKAAINNSALGMNAPGEGPFPTPERGPCPCGSCSLAAITAVADALAAEPHRRKTLLFIGELIPMGLPPGPPTCDTYTASERMLRAAQAANLTVHALDPNGLEVTSVQASTNLRSEGQGAAAAAKERSNRASLMLRHDTLRTLAEETGGRAVLNTNAPTDSIRSILDETGSYYLVAFQTPDRRSDGRFHRITVKVNRRDVDVRTRRGYFAPRDTTARRASPPPAEGSLEELTRGLLPHRGLPMTLTAAPFAMSGGTGAALVLALSVSQPPLDAPPPDLPHAEAVEILAGAYDADGMGADWHRQSFDLPLPGPHDGRLQYEALSRIDLKPGRYEVRVGARHRHAGREGSVQTYMEVPDFAREPVSLSGVVVHDSGSVHATPSSVLGGILPDAPTARRDFGSGDEVSAMVRVYQRRSGSAVPVELTFRVLDASLNPAWTHTGVLDSADFDTMRSADRRVRLPLEALPPGEYMLSVEAHRDQAVARRDVRFRVR